MTSRASPPSAVQLLHGRCLFNTQAATSRDGCVLGHQKNRKERLDLGKQERPHVSRRQAEILRDVLVAAMTSVKGQPSEFVPQVS